MEWHKFQSFIGHFSAHSKEQIRKAFDLGQTLHAGQKRKSGEPYFTHPIAIAAKLASIGADEETIIAALLHDTVEDTPITLEEIEKQFGKSVTKLIDGVTKLSSSDVAGPNVNEQTETLRKIFRLMQEDTRIMIIKLYDRLHNMETVQFLSAQKAQILAQETYDVYAKIADRLCMEDLRYELEEHCLRTLNPVLFERLVALRDKNMEQAQILKKKMQETLRTSHPELHDSVRMELEPKSWEKLEAQLDLQGGAVSGHTPASIAFICTDRDVCYRVLGAIHTPWKREILSFRDFINSPEANGYRGLHTTVILEDGSRMRCKIRTEEMHQYAHNGVTMYCFDKKKERELHKLLPWTEHIESISEDTQHMSDEFWQGLQSDILGETITIYGPDDSTIHIPKNATALDAAFYLFRDVALHQTSIRLNGKEVQPWFSGLKQSDALEISLDKNLMAERGWLEWVQTGFALATIRNALAANMPREELQDLGKKILQKFLEEKRHGFLEEVEKNHMNNAMERLGYSSPEAAYQAIGEGRLDPARTDRELFPPKKREIERSSVTIRAKAPSGKRLSLEQFSHLQEEYGDHWSWMYLEQSVNGKAPSVSIHGQFGEPEITAITRLLARLGCTNVDITRPRSKVASIGVVALLFLVWGIDPVLAYQLLHKFSVMPTDLVIVRFWSLSLLGFLYLLWRRARSPVRAVRLSPWNASLWLTSAFQFAIAYTTYVSLQNTLPIYYSIPMTAGGIALTTTKFPKLRWLLAPGLFFAIGVAILITYSPSWPPVNILMTLLAVLFFSGFFVTAARYKEKEHVSARADQFFFLTSLICLIGTLPLLQDSHLLSILPTTFVYMVLFSIFITGLPYYILYYFLKTKDFTLLGNISFVTMLCTALTQWFILGAPNAVSLVSGGFVLAGAFLIILLQTKLRSR